MTQLVKAIGSDVCVNDTATLGPQNGASVAALSNGRWVVTWQGNGSGDYGVFQQVYDGDGNKWGDLVKFDGGLPGAGALPNGGWVLTWSQSSGNDPGNVNFRFYDDFDSQYPLAGVNSTRTGQQYKSNVTVLSDGSFVVTWHGNGTFPGNVDIDGVFVKAFRADGIARTGEILVNTTTQGYQFGGKTTALSDGRWVVTWTGFGAQPGQEDTDTGVFQQVFNADGTKSGGEIRVNSTTYGTQNQPTVIGLGDGGWLTTWSGPTENGAPVIFLQRYNAAGEKTFNSDQIAVSGSFAVDYPTVSTLSNGGWVIAWAQSGPTGYDILQQVYNADGTKNGGPIVVNTTLEGRQVNPSLTSLKTTDGSVQWVVTWEGPDANGVANDGDIFQRRFVLKNSPTDIVMSGGSIAETASIGDEVASLSTQDLDQGDAHTYSIVANAAGDELTTEHPFFGIEGNKIKLKAGLDDPQVGTHDLWVKSTDSDGMFTVKKLTITVTNVNEAPSSIDFGTDGLTAAHAVQTAQSGAELGTLRTRDPDGDTSFTYRIVLGNQSDVSPDAGGPFKIGDGAKLQVNSHEAFSALAGTTATVWIKVTDAGGKSAWQAFTVAVEANAAPTGIAVTGGTVAETAQVGETVATLATNDQAGDTHAYELVANAAGDPLQTHPLFDMQANKIVLKAGLDDDQVGPHDLWVKTTDSGGLSFVGKVTVTVTNVNEAPTAVILSGTTVAENARNGTPIGTLSAQDPDTGDTFSYTLLDNAGGRFAVNAGRLVVADGTKLDYETARSHQIKIRVTDKDGLVHDETLTIRVTDVAETSGNPGQVDAPLVLRGTSRSETLVGQGGNDLLYGFKGNDRLYGNGGSDRIYGGAGKDSLSGGAGKDVFVLDSLSKTNALNRKENLDKIADFSVVDDSIYLENKVFKALGKSGSLAKPKALSKSMFFVGTKAHDGNDHLIYNKKTGALYYDADGTGHQEQIQIATLSKNLKLTYHDFLVI